MFEISTLKEKKISELQEIANELGIKKTAGIKKLDLAYKIIDHYASNPKESNRSNRIGQCGTGGPSPSDPPINGRVDGQVPYSGVRASGSPGPLSN